jgi:adenylate cyclase
MQRHLEFVRANPDKTGLPPLNARVGVNSGEMLVGNLGSEYRFSYGALGDNVNLASRLEGLNKIYGTRIIIGEKTEALVRGGFHTRMLGAVRVKGRVQPEKVFELLAPAEETLPDDLRAAMDCYAQGYDRYLAQDWDGAVALFRKGQEIRPGDLSFTVMTQRCTLFSRQPPGEAWDGVFMERRK